MKMKAALFVLAFLFASISLNNAQCSVETDTDFLGAPLSNDLSTVQAASFQDCCDKCNAQTEANCAAWTFSGGFCFLKSGPGLRTRSVGSNKPIIQKILQHFFFTNSFSFLFQETSGLRQGIAVVRSGAPSSTTGSIQAFLAFTTLVNMIAFKFYF